MHEEMIVGKPYRIWAGPKDGTFMVSWGDQSFLWEPKDWQAPTLAGGGPVFYERWVQPATSSPGKTRWQNASNMRGGHPQSRLYAGGFREFGLNYMTQWNVEMFSPDGTPRHKEAFEWATSVSARFGWVAGRLIGTVLAQYSFVFIAPDDFRG